MRLENIPIRDVWRALGGGPLRGNHGQARWRGGDGYNVALDLKKNVFFDHRDGKGGGILELAEVALGCDRRSALQWLETNCGLDSRRSLSTNERRVFAERRRAASSFDEEITNWRAGLIPELNARKIAALKSGDDDALSWAASTCNTLENGSPADVAREFHGHRASDPANVERLIAIGQAYGLEAERIAAEAVLLLARAAREDSE
jgi:hypothetical protein